MKLPRNPIPPLVLLITLAGAVIVYQFFQAAVLPRYKASRAVLISKSELRLSMLVKHDRGAIVEEEYTMANIDGVSTSRYRVVGRNNLQVAIDERPRETTEYGPNVAYFFQQTVADGIWELQTHPPRGDTSVHYTIDVYQLVNGQHGSRHIVFTDPHYWATTGGHQFTIHLDKHKPTPDLINLTSTALVEPRFEKVIADFRAFGPDSFRSKVSAARVRLGARS